MLANQFNIYVVLFIASSVLWDCGYKNALPIVMLSIAIRAIFIVFVMLYEDEQRTKKLKAEELEKYKNEPRCATATITRPTPFIFSDKKTIDVGYAGNKAMIETNSTVLIPTGTVFQICKDQKNFTEIEIVNGTVSQAFLTSAKYRSAPNEEPAFMQGNQKIAFYGEPAAVDGMVDKCSNSVFRLHPKTKFNIIIDNEKVTVNGQVLLCELNEPIDAYFVR